jgi:hypothetical protein
MSEDAVVNWDAIIHKNVRSKDGQDAGNVDAIIKGDTVVITSEGDRQEYSTKIRGRRIQWCRSIFENSFWRIKKI